MVRVILVIRVYKLCLNSAFNMALVFSTAEVIFLAFRVE